MVRYVETNIYDYRFIDANNNGYNLDLSVDNKNFPFDDSDVEVKSGARLGKIIFLLNTKAFGWFDRLPYEEDYQEKRNNDAADILFCVQRLRGQQNIDRSQLNYVYHRNFWVDFHRQNPNMKNAFKAAGLWTDETNFGSSSTGSRPSTGSARASNASNSGGRQSGSQRSGSQQSVSRHSGGGQSASHVRDGSQNSSVSSNRSRRR